MLLDGRLARFSAIFCS